MAFFGRDFEHEDTPFVPGAAISPSPSFFGESPSQAATVRSPAAADPVPPGGASVGFLNEFFNPGLRRLRQKQRTEFIEDRDKAAAAQALASKKGKAMFSVLNQLNVTPEMMEFFMSHPKSGTAFIKSEAIRKAKGEEGEGVVIRNNRNGVPTFVTGPNKGKEVFPGTIKTPSSKEDVNGVLRWTSGPQQGEKVFPKVEPDKEDRAVRNDITGMSRFVDTGERVFPGVRKDPQMREDGNGDLRFTTGKRAGDLVFPDVIKDPDAPTIRSDQNSVPRWVGGPKDGQPVFPEVALGEAKSNPKTRILNKLLSGIKLTPQEAALAPSLLKSTGFDFGETPPEILKLLEENAQIQDEFRFNPVTGKIE